MPSAPKCTKTRSPSTIGVGDAQLFFGLISFAEWTVNTNVLTSSRPLASSYPSRRSDTSPFRGSSSMAVVSHTRPSATTGDDQPRPGTGTFHATLLVSLHSRGRFAAFDSPCPPGPRNCGHCSAVSPVPSSSTHAPAATTARDARVIGWGRASARLHDRSAGQRGASAAHACASPGAAGPLPKTSTIVAATGPMLTKVC